MTSTLSLSCFQNFNVQNANALSLFDLKEFCQLVEDNVKVKSDWSGVIPFSIHDRITELYDASADYWNLIHVEDILSYFNAVTGRTFLHELVVLEAELPACLLLYHLRKWATHIDFPQQLKGQLQLNSHKPVQCLDLQLNFEPLKSMRQKLYGWLDRKDYTQEETALDVAVHLGLNNLILSMFHAGARFENLVDLVGHSDGVPIQFSEDLLHRLDLLSNLYQLVQLTSRLRFTDLEVLTHLSRQSNQLTSIPESIGQLINLYKLSLSNNDSFKQLEVKLVFVHSNTPYLHVLLRYSHQTITSEIFCPREPGYHPRIFHAMNSKRVYHQSHKHY